MATVHRITDSLHLTLLNGDGGSSLINTDFHGICIDSMCEDSPFTDYFGPSNLKRVFDFCRMLETEMVISKVPVALVISADERCLPEPCFSLART